MSKKILEKIVMVGTAWSLMQVARHLFITRNIGLEFLWLALAAAYAALWGTYSDDS